VKPTNTSSTFAYIDTQKGILVKTFSLQGNFDLDAVSPDGSRVYLLERLHDTTGHYYVRRYDVQTNQLVQGVIADKSELNDPRMLGSALTRQMAQDGSRAYTLYTDTRSNIAFVHILPLASDFNGARCINLPVGKSADMLHYYTLALSSDGSTLYATNAALGVMVVINVSDKDAFSDDIRTTVHFSPSNAQVTPNEKMRLLYNGAILSSDQSTLYVVGMRGIEAIALVDAKLKQRYAQQQVFTGIALSTDGQMLYGVSPNDGITLVNLQSGQTQQMAQSPIQAPWNIEWVSRA
jgi:DNA-binding beta-propeller fold protein YncE